MMDKLDDLRYIASLDKSFASKSMALLTKQCQQAWEETQKIDFPPIYQRAVNIVISGMGGSTYGARIVKSLYDGRKMQKVPIELSNDYYLPGYVNKDTLVILSSYSGTTEETISCAQEALEKGARICILCSGGKLADLAISQNLPGYIFKPVNNPSKQPRIGVGYMVIGLIGLLANLGYLPVGNEEISQVVAFLETKTTSFLPSTILADNPGKQWAVKLYDKVPIFIFADFLAGAAYAVRNPFHETAKQFCFHFPVPELNHHLLEGLSYPPIIKNNFVFIFVNSEINDKRNIKRLKLTREVVKKNGFSTFEINLTGSTALVQTMEFIQLGGWISFYLAMMNNQDPAKIPWVDYFKMKLSP